ncbi:MAG: FliM/FliN family flagellar motor switch protein [Legionellales bacterium]
MSDKKRKTTTTEALDTQEIDNVSAVFFSHYNMPRTLLENKKIAGIVEHVTNLFQKSLSAFLGKKIELTFNTMKFCTISELNLDKTPYVLSSIHFAPSDLSGLIFFDYAFMHHVIDLLYGAGIYKSDSVISGLGKSGGVIAKKVTEFFIAALQEAISEYEKIQMSLLKTTEQNGLILNQPLSDQFFDLTFNVHFNGMDCQLHAAIPDVIFENITLGDRPNPVASMDYSTVTDSLKKDIIDSTVTLIASLQDIKIKVSDIMALKAGDMIAISDPTVVYLAHNQKKIFKASVGQSNSLRVVKILDPL